ncbi:MAG: bifunctional demethylmenaquinone methyltransferase/2-methoxy-6-polyprenyl-1,4-benzoquinol methylase UbiE [Anaerolineae bacterium]|nr:bifunctional demethylmenaquinone methyltransferase/2-methoxy-6-polyprenyl-1,4-benzoquinol methylase UbiE [Anaerolineae bacterium]
MTFNSAQEKHAYVNQMFARIAHRYDRMNRLMTAGQDQRWRKLLIQQAKLPQHGRLLDLATGTGDIAFEALQQRPDLVQVIGADFTLPMMQVGQQRADKLEPVVSQKMIWSGADALHLPFPDNQFDAVVSGFLMRNVVDIRQALTEQVRVCKPGGRVVILEIPRPAETVLGRLFRLYFHNVVPVLGGLITGQGDAYSYLPSSADAFLRPEELQAEMEEVGLDQVGYTKLMLNTVALHVGIKCV